MNKQHLLLCISALLALLLLAGCPAPYWPEPPEDLPEYISPHAAEPAASNEQTGELVEAVPLTPELELLLPEQLNTFALRTAPAVLADGEDNMLYSPTGLYLALSMLWECSGGDTRQELEALLLPYGEQQGAAMENLLDSMVFENSHGRQTVDNVIFQDEFSEIDSAVLDILTTHYRAQLSPLNTGEPGPLDDFADGEAAQRYSDAALVLVNSLRFQDSWQDPFDPENTRERPFILAGDEKITVEMMNARAERELFLRHEQFSAARRWFKNGSSVTFILPEEGITPADLLRDSEALASAMDFSPDNPHSLRGSVSYLVPKLRYSTAMDLEEILQDLGVVSAFQGGLDAISHPAGPVAVAAVRQLALVEMDEEGATAAARTEIALASSAASEEDRPPHLDLHLTRPYLFFITAPEGYVTFVGIIQQP